MHRLFADVTEKKEETKTMLSAAHTTSTAIPFVQSLTLVDGFEYSTKTSNGGRYLIQLRPATIGGQDWTLAGSSKSSRLDSNRDWKTLSIEARQEKIDAAIHRCAKEFSIDMAALQDGVEVFVADCAGENLLIPPAFGDHLSLGKTSLKELLASLPSQLTQLKHARQREMLACSIRDTVQLDDYPETFRAASQSRRFIAVLGPTNSGKTHLAFKRLAEAESGVYLGPLRLLALEAYTRLNTEFGVETSLITGEERRINPFAKVTASTVEMLNPEKRLHVAVIDEVQMLADPERGWAWTQAIIGANAQEVWLLGSESAEPALRALATRLGIEIEVRFMERKSPLLVAERPLDTHNPAAALEKVKAGDALIVFSRKDALALRDALIKNGFSVACVYGALSPEVREREARRFADGDAQVLVATDAIGMGLNLPIQRIVFTSVQKYDGEDRSDLPAALLQQIAGRAGRFGHHACGEVVGLTLSEHVRVVEWMATRSEPLCTTGFAISPSMSQLMGISMATNEKQLAVLMTMFIQHASMGETPIFVAGVQNEQFVRAELVDRIKDLTLAQKFTLSMAPMNTRDPDTAATWGAWANAVAAKRQISLSFLREVPLNRANLGQAEQMVKFLAAYRWMALRLPQYFTEGLEADEQTAVWAGVVECHLKSKARQSEHGRGGRKLPDWYWAYREY